MDALLRPQGALYMRSRRVRCPPGLCKQCEDIAAAVDDRAAGSSATRVGQVLAYICTAVGPAMGAATAAWIGASMRETIGCQHISAVVIAALCSAIAQCIATSLAAMLIAARGDSWRASVTPGLGFGEFSALGRDTRKLVRKQSAKAAVKSVASRAIAGAVGSELGVVATVVCAIVTAVTGGVAASVSIEAAQKRTLSPRRAMTTAYKATFKTAIKTAISTSLRESLRRVLPHCAPVLVSALCCGTGIGLRNWIVDVLDEMPTPPSPPLETNGCPHHRGKQQRRARCC